MQYKITNSEYDDIYQDIRVIILYFKKKTIEYNAKVSQCIKSRDKREKRDKKVKTQYIKKQWYTSLEEFSHINYRTWYRWFKKELYPKKFHFFFIKNFANWIKQQRAKELKEKDLLSVLSSPILTSLPPSKSDLKSK